MADVLARGLTTEGPCCARFRCSTPLQGPGRGSIGCTGLAWSRRRQRQGGVLPPCTARVSPEWSGMSDGSHRMQQWSGGQSFKRTRRPGGLRALGWAAILWMAMVTLPSLASAQPAQTTRGLGLALGDPSGVTFKQGIGESRAWDLHVGWGAAWGRRLRVHGDWLRQYELTTFDAGLLQWYWGLGLKAGVYDRGWDRRGRRDRYRADYGHLTVGGRIPFGLAMAFSEAPLELFLEVAPGVRILAPADPGIFVDSLLGVRVRF